MIKKSLIFTTSLVTLFTPFALSLNASAAEENPSHSTELVSSYTNDDVQYNILKDSNPDIEKTQIVEDNKTINVERNLKTGEIFVDGELTAIIEEGPKNTIETPEEPEITPFKVSSAKYYTIGTDYGSGTLVYKYDKTFTLKYLSAKATITALSASLIAAFVEYKPSIKAAAIVSTAAGLMALTTTDVTYKLKYTHYKDKKKSFYFVDTLGVYKSSVKAANLKYMITHNYGEV